MVDGWPDISPHDFIRVAALRMRDNLRGDLGGQPKDDDGAQG